MSTKKEITGKRSLLFSGWVRTHLLDSSILHVTDLDFILSNVKGRKVMMLEVKTNNGQIPRWQNIIFHNLSHWIERGIDNNWTYVGFHTIRFKKSFFNDGQCYFDNQLVSEDELQSKLNNLIGSKYDTWSTQ